MSNEKMFEYAAKNKLRFAFKGIITTEDLYDISVENLDSIFKSLNSQIKTAQEESLLNTKTKEDKELDVKIEIVKYIVAIKLEEKAQQLKSKEQKEKKQKLLEILSAKQDEDLQSKSIDEIKAMINELNN